MEKLYLIDGMSLVFRAYHAMSRSGLKAPNGEPSGAAFGFVNLITSLIEKENPKKMVVVFDREEPTFRHKMYPEYKANRDEFPEELIPQMKRIKEFLNHANIPQTEVATYDCLTSDKDFYQLVNDKVKLYKPSRQKNEDFDIVDIEAVKKKFGVTPDKVIDVLAILGDSSDNVPGVKGVGEKTAIPLIQKYGSLEELYNHLDEVDKPAVKSKLEENKDNAFLSKELVTIMTDVPVELDNSKFSLKKPDYKNLDNLFATMGFRTIREKWMKKAKDDLSVIDDISNKHGGMDTIENVQKKYILVDDKAKLNEILEQIGKPEILSVDLETSSLDRQTCDIVGIALSHKEGYGYYIAVYNDKPKTNIEFAYNDKGQGDLFGQVVQKADTAEDKEPKFKSIPLSTALSKLKNILEDISVGKCGQNIKFDAFILKRYEINLSPIVFDSMIASYLLNPDVPHNMDALAQKWLNYSPIPISSLIGKKKSQQISMKEIDPKNISDYACEDADVALRLRNRLNEELKKENLSDLAEKVEFPLIEVLLTMESNGVALDRDFLKELSVQINKESGILTEKIYHEAGIEFNIDSTKQLGHVLFEKLGIPPIKKTKTGHSTDVSVLTELAPIYPIAEYLLEYRQLVKLNSTYVDALPKLINPETRRLHTTYNQTITSTGRLSSTDPNLQNIPIRTELGSKVRMAFVPGDNKSVILSADYSQIELRIMAHYCGDVYLIDAFKKGLDIHSTTAALLFEKRLDEVDKDMRRVAKTVNFGIMYGLGSFGLSQRLGIPRGEGKDIIDNYFEKYPGIKRYMDETIEKTRKKGFAETLLGRRRYFPDILSRNNNLRTTAERAAINMPKQGTAYDMMKIAMIKVDNAMKEKKVKSLMMLQVHDELVFEVPKDELEMMTELVKNEMESAMELGEVPVVVETGTGKNWFEAH